MAHKQGVLAVVGMIFVLLSVSLALPAIVLSLENPQSHTLTHNESERLVLTGVVSTEATEIVAGGNGYVNITVINERTGEIEHTGQVQEGGSDVLEFTGGNITITNIDIISGTEALIEYEYPTYIGFPDNSQIVFQNMELFIVLITIVMLAGVIMVVSGVYS